MYSGRNLDMEIGLCRGFEVLHSLLLSLIPRLSKLRDLLEYLMLPSWPQTCVFSARSQIWERSMQEADPGAPSDAPGCQVRLGGSGEEGGIKTLRDLMLMPKFLSHVGSPQQWPHNICTWITQITDSHPTYHTTVPVCPVTSEESQ